MAKLSKSKLASNGSKIMAEAKKVKKTHPSMKWQNCVKKGAANVKSKMQKA